jgi:hypothetical protein
MDDHCLEVVAIAFASLLEGGSDIVSIIFTKKGSKYNHSVTISMNTPGIIHGTSLKIIFALLTLIFMMRQ